MKPEDGSGIRPLRPRQASARIAAKTANSDEARRDGLARFVTSLMVVAAFGSILMAVQKIESAFEHNITPTAGPVAVLQPLQNGMAGQASHSPIAERE